MCTEENKLNWEEIRERNKRVPVHYDRDKLFEGLSEFLKDYCNKNGHDIIVSDEIILENDEGFKADIVIGKFTVENGKYKGTPEFVIDIQPADVIYAVDLLRFKALGANGAGEYWVFNSHVKVFDTYIFNKPDIEAGRLYSETRSYALGSSVCPRVFWKDQEPVLITPADFF